MDFYETIRGTKSQCCDVFIFLGFRYLTRKELDKLPLELQNILTMVTETRCSKCNKLIKEK